MSYILGIDTSCDDTSVAVLKNDRVVSNIVASQLDIHKQWGGVVPNLARRAHEATIQGCIDLALKRAGLNTIQHIDALAVTYGPGLAPALEVGIHWAKKIATEHHLPLIAVNHIEGHILSPLLKNSKGVTYSGMGSPFSSLALCVSGRHTELIWVEALGSYKIIGHTLDDAAGEAFDKVARMLDLGYLRWCGDCNILQKAERYCVRVTTPLYYSKDYHFSFQGLKLPACIKPMI